MLDEYNQRYIADNNIIELTKAETEILYIFIKEKGKIVSNELLEWIIYRDITGDSKKVKGRISKLRKKLSGALEVKTKRQKGYYI